MIFAVRFNIRYFLLTIILFVTEVLIALYVHDNFIRPYFGDTLVVLLIYCFVKSFVNTPVVKTAIAVLLFSYLIETLQYLNFISMVGLEHSAIARVVLGTSFAWIDMLAYTIGILLILLLEYFWGNKKPAQ